MASQTNLVCTPMWPSTMNGEKRRSVMEETNFELIQQIALEKNVAESESYTRNGESNVGILVTNVSVVCFFVMSNFTSQKIFVVLRRNVFDMKSDSRKPFPLISNINYVYFQCTNLYILDE